jgi:RNA polymerase sigma factor (sigma-70 family)
VTVTGSADRVTPGTTTAQALDEAELIRRLRAGDELAARVRLAIDALPQQQRQVVTLRDVEGLSSMEVCEVLGITDGNQRVLLHRGRGRVRADLEQEMLS